MGSNESNQPAPRVTVGALFRRRGFWFNFAITLLATCWVPLLTIQPRFEVMPPVTLGEQANTGALPTTPEAPPQQPGPAQVVQGEKRRVPLYECYAGLGRLLSQGDFDNKAMKIYGGAVAAHLLLCFVISLWVWLIVLRNAARNNTED